MSTALVLARRGTADTVHGPRPVEGKSGRHCPVSSPCRGGEPWTPAIVLALSRGGAVDTGHCTRRVEGAAGGHTPIPQMGPAPPKSTDGPLICVRRVGCFHRSLGQVWNWGVSPLRPNSTDDRLICVRGLGASTGQVWNWGVSPLRLQFHRWVLPQMVV